MLHSSGGPTNHQVQGLSLDHWCCLHFNSTIKSLTKLSWPCLTHSTAYWTGPNCWWPSVSSKYDIYYTGSWVALLTNNTNVVLVHESCIFLFCWPFLFSWKEYLQPVYSLFTVLYYAFSMAICVPESYRVWHFIVDLKILICIVVASNSYFNHTLRLWGSDMVCKHVCWNPRGSQYNIKRS